MGSVIDQFTVVRLKRGLVETYDRKDWGSRTDYLCACSSRFDWGHHPFWLAENPKKYTTGLCAVLEAYRRLNPKELLVIGFDRLMYPDRPVKQVWPAHNAHEEHEILMSLGVKELG